MGGRKEFRRLGALRPHREDARCATFQGRRHYAVGEWHRTPAWRHRTDDLERSRGDRAIVAASLAGCRRPHLHRYAGRRRPRRARRRDRRTDRWIAFAHHHHRASRGMTMLPTERISYSPIATRPPLKLPNAARMAVWVIVNVEEWDARQTMPRTVLTPPAGGSPTPDIPNWAWHEYGNRVGFWRLLQVFDDYKIPGDFVIVEHLEQPPKPDAVAVFMPGPVRNVRGRRAACGWRKYRARHRLPGIPLLDVDDHPHRHARGVRQ